MYFHLFQMYRPYYNRQHQRTCSTYEDNEIYQSQRRLYSLFESSASQRVQRVLHKNHQFTHPWSPFDRWERQALPVLLPSCSNITEVVYPEPSTDRSSITATLSREEEEGGEVFTCPEMEVNNSVMSGNEYPAKEDLSDPRNDSGFGSTSDTPSTSRAPDFIRLDSKEISQNEKFTLNSKRQHITSIDGEKSGPIYISDDEKSSAVDSDSDDPDMNHSECKGDGNSTPSSESSGTDSADVANQTLVTSMERLKNQKHFFKCDYCDFKALNKGKMKTHFGITGHSFAADIMGFFENETYHCKSIIEPVAIHLFANKKNMGNLTDLVIMCPICFSHFPSMYKCNNHALRNHGENVYGVGKVVGRHVISLPVGLRCLCGQQCREESQIRKHLNTCKNFQIMPEPNISYLYVCPFCIQFFGDIHGFHVHIQTETNKYNLRQNVMVTIIHVRHPTVSRAMLPYACGPTLQDTSVTRVISRQQKKKAMKEWRKNKNNTLGSYYQMNHNKKSENE